MTVLDVTSVDLSNEQHFAVHNYLSDNCMIQLTELTTELK